MTHTRNRIGGGLATIGVLIILVELVRYWLLPAYAISGAVVGIGCMIGFVGFYLIAPQEAEDGGGFIVTSFVRVVQAVPNPFGRRATDGASVTVTKVTPAPAPHPTVTEEHDG